MILADPRHEPKVRQGVTTEVIGVDGNSYAPFEEPADLSDFVRLNGGLDGRPDIAYDWDTVASYLARFDRQVSVNIAYLVGNSALRIAALGWEERAGRRQSPRTDARCSCARRWPRARSASAPASTTRPARTRRPTSSPSSPGRRAATGGIYHTHVRYPLGDRFLDPFREAIEIGRRGEAPAHITHFYHRATFPGTPEQMLELVDDARAEGLDVTFDTYPYEWASTRLLILIPTWVQAGGPDATKERLADPARARADPPRARGSGRAVRRRRRPRGRAARLLRPAREPALGGPNAG